MLMKALLGLAALALTLTSTIASANVMRKACDFKDYQYIQQALKQGRVLEGAEKKASLEEVLMQEMGPTCVRLIPMTPRFGISGTDYSQYEIATGSARFALSISFSRVTDPGFKVYIR
jgi:hypothetical protein